MTRDAQPTAMPWVVRVEAVLDQLSSAQRVVVGDGAGCSVAEDADRVAFEDLAAEPVAVLLVIAAPGGRGSAVCLGLTGRAGAGAVVVLFATWAAGAGFDWHNPPWPVAPWSCCSWP